MEQLAQTFWSLFFCWMSTPVSVTNHSIPLSQFQNKRKLTWKAECVCLSEEGFLGGGAELRPQGESPDSQGQESLKYEVGILLTLTATEE